MNPFELRTRILLWLLVAGIVSGVRPAWGLLPFPIGAGQRATIRCLENTNYTYDCYLPPNYTTNTPLPILYTMNPNGGGMVSTFQTACAGFNTICIGINGTHNNQPWAPILGEFCAVTRDIRLRVCYDPSQEFVGGLSGGGECSYMFSRFRSQHVAGLIEMAGWLGRANLGPSVQYYGIDRVQTNLLIMRTTGNTDTSAIFYNQFDSNYLATCHAHVYDFSFTGGHQSAPEATIETCLRQLQLRHRVPGPDDQNNALALSTNWQARIAAGQSSAVFRECVSNLIGFQRSWYAYQAQLTLDQLLANYDSFRKFDVSNLAQGDYAADLFYYYALGAATNGDWARYDSCLKALTGITVTNDYNGTTTITGFTCSAPYAGQTGSIYITTANNDHAGDIFNLLTTCNYPGPLAQGSAAPTAGQMNVWLAKDTPCLAYSLQSTTDFLNGPWQDMDVIATDTNTLWSASFDLPPDAANTYYRIVTVPTPDYSPPWPPQ